MKRFSSTTVAPWLLLAPLAGTAMVNARQTSLAWAMAVAAAGFISLLSWWRFFRDRRSVHRPEFRGRDLTWLALSGPAYVALQLLPLPLALVRLISPRRAELTEALGAVMPVPAFVPLSVEPASTVTALCTVMACTVCFLLVRELTWRSLRNASWSTVLPIVVLAAFQGAIALEQALRGEEITGTYWNRNHFAGFLEMVLPFAMVYAAHLAYNRSASSRASARRMMRSFVVETLLPVAAVTMLLIGVIASGSRLGFVSMLAGVLSMALTLALTRLTGRLRITAIAALPVLGIAMFLFLANRELLFTLSRYIDSTGDMTGENRLPIWADTLQLYHAYPLFGSGLGTYSTAFVAFQTSGLANHWTHAHNDYLEFVSELGAVGFAIFSTLFVAVIWRALKLVKASRRSGSDLVALGCIGGITAIAFHSLGDFNLNLPANIFLLSWIAGIAAGVPPPIDDAGGAERHVARGGSRGRRLFIALSLITVALSSVAIASSMRGDTARPVSVDAQLEAVRRSPASPFLWLDLADALKAAGRVDDAKASMARAVALAPHHSVLIRRAATLADELGDRAQAVSLISREFQEKGTDPAELFDWFVERGISHAEVLAGVSPDARALPAFVKYLLLPGTCPEAVKAWHELVTRFRPESKIAGDYINFVASDCGLPGEADRAWDEYAKKVQPGYREVDWVFNGGFERTSASVRFDWQWRSDAREAEAVGDDVEKFSGARSLRMSFRGPSQSPYEGASQYVVVTPGRYRVSAAVRTQELSSADGIAFRITGEGRPRIDIQTPQTTATTPWHTVTTEVVVPEGISLLRLQIVRRPGPEAAQEGDIKGTAWVDEVTLRKIG